MEARRKSLARKIVRDCYRVKKGDMVLISTDRNILDLAMAVGVECHQVGATPGIMVTSSEYSSSCYKVATVETLCQTPKHILAACDTLDVYMSLAAPSDPALLRDVPAEKMKAIAEANKPVQDKITAQKVRSGGVMLPTPGLAKLFNLTYEELERKILKALDTDYEKMLQIGRRLENVLRGSTEVEVSSKSGTNIMFSVAGRHWLIDDGVISDEDVARGDVILNLPTGEVFIAPVEDSVSGVFVMDTPRFYKGLKIAGVRLRFENGKIVDFKAEEGEDAFKEILETNTGDKDKFAEFGIGINADAELNAPLILEEKAIGTIHVAIGDNTSFGGKNDSTLHLDLISVNPTVKVDGKPFMIKGKLQI